MPTLSLIERDSAPAQTSIGSTTEQRVPTGPLSSSLSLSRERLRELAALSSYSLRLLVAATEKRTNPSAASSLERVLREVVIQFVSPQEKNTDLLHMVYLGIGERTLTLTVQKKTEERKKNSLEKRAIREIYLIKYYCTYARDTTYVLMHVRDTTYVLMQVT